MPSVRNGETGSRKRDSSVHFLGRGPQGQVTMEWEGWSGLRALARCWVQRSWRWSSTGREFGFGVEVAGGGFVVGAHADPQGRILDSLDLLDIGRGSVWEPDSCISGDRRDECCVLSMVSV